MISKGFKFVAALFIFHVLTLAAAAADLPALESGDRAPFPTFLYDAGPTIDNIYQFPAEPQDGERVMVTLRAYPDPLLPTRPVTGATLSYRVNDGEWVDKDMIRDDMDKDFFFSYIPPARAGDQVTWFVSAADMAGNLTSEVPESREIGFKNIGDGKLATVSDANEDDLVLPAPIDVLEFAIGQDGEKAYMHVKTEEEPANGNAAKEGAFGYAMFALEAQPYVGLGNALSGQADIPLIVNAPMLSAMLGLPKAAMVNAKQLMQGGGEIKDTGFELKRLKSGLRMQFNLKNEAADYKKNGFKTAAITIALKQGSTDFWPWEATPYLTAFFRQHDYSVSPVSSKGGPVKASAASVDLTPPIGTPLNGFGARQGKPSTGMHDPIRGDAIYLEAGDRPEQKFVLIGTDLTLLRRNLYKDVAKGIEEKTGVPRTNVILTASHSHASFGALFPETAVLSGKYDPAVYDATVEKLIQAGVNAAANPQPAKLTVAVGQALGASRNREYDDGPVDPKVGVLKVDALDGKTIAVLVNFSAHPTNIDGIEFSADYPAYVKAEIEDRFPGAIGVFMNGAQGDQGPGCAPGDCGEKWTKIEKLGRYIANQGLEAVKDAAPYEAPRLNIQYQDLLLGPKFDFRAAQSVMQIGDSVLASIPGELFVELGLEIKEKAYASGYRDAFVLGLANDSIGYMQRPDEFLKHKYTSIFTMFGVEEGEFIQGQAVRLVEKQYE